MVCGCMGCARLRVMGEAQPLVVVMYSKTEIVIVSNQGVKKEVVYRVCSKGRNFVSFEGIHDLTTV